MINKKNIMSLSQYNREVLRTDDYDVMGMFDISKIKANNKPNARISLRQPAQQIDHDLLADKVAQRINGSQQPTQQVQSQQIDTRALVESLRKELAPMVAGSRSSGIINTQDSGPQIAIIPQTSGLKTTGTIGEERTSTMSDLDSLFALTVPDNKG